MTKMKETLEQVNVSFEEYRKEKETELKNYEAMVGSYVEIIDSLKGNVVKEDVQ